MMTLLIILTILVFLAFVGRSIETRKQPKLTSGPTVNAKAVGVSEINPSGIQFTLTAPKGGVWCACHLVLDDARQMVHVAGIPTPAADGTVARLQELGAEIVEVHKAASLSLVSITSNLEVNQHLLQQFPASCKLG